MSHYNLHNHHIENNAMQDPAVLHSSRELQLLRSKLFLLEELHKTSKQELLDQSIKLENITFLYTTEQQVAKRLVEKNAIMSNQLETLRWTVARQAKEIAELNETSQILALDRCLQNQNDLLKHRTDQNVSVGFLRQGGCPFCRTQEHSIVNCAFMKDCGYTIERKDASTNDSRKPPSTGRKRSRRWEIRQLVDQATNSALQNDREVLLVDGDDPAENHRLQETARSVLPDETPSLNPSPETTGVHRQEDDDDDDVEIVEPTNLSPGNPQKLDDDEIEILGTTGTNPLSDYAHPRFDCTAKPFEKDPEDHCPNCYCYVCDVLASDCEHWKGHGDNSHCFAHRKIPMWKRRRSKLICKRLRPARALREIAIYLPDTVPQALPRKRKTRERILFGQPGYDKQSDVRQAMEKRKKTNDDADTNEKSS